MKNNEPLEPQVQANRTRLSDCPRHEFVRVEADLLSGARYECRHCKGCVTDVAAAWYERGIQHQLNESINEATQAAIELHSARSTCVQHEFIARTPGRLKTCTHCGTTVTALTAHWYQAGLNHGNGHSRAKAERDLLLGIIKDLPVDGRPLSGALVSRVIDALLAVGGAE